MAKLSNLELFKGKISDVKREILTHTSGSTSISTNPFTDRVSGSGSVETHHQYYTEFELCGTQFRFDGDFTFKDGDEVALYAERTGKGFCKVKILKNATRNFFDNEVEKESHQIFAFIGGFFGGYVGGLFIIFIIGLIASFVLGVDLKELTPAGSKADRLLTIATFCVVCPILGLLGSFTEYKKRKAERAKFAAMIAEIQSYKGEKGENKA